MNNNVLKKYKSSVEVLTGHVFQFHSFYCRTKQNIDLTISYKYILNGRKCILISL
jgi:hypothetical protein